MALRSLVDDERVSGCGLWSSILISSAFSYLLEVETSSGFDLETFVSMTSAPGDDGSLGPFSHPSDLVYGLSCSPDNQYDDPAQLPDGDAFGCWLPRSGLQTIKMRQIGQ